MNDTTTVYNYIRWKLNNCATIQHVHKQCSCNNNRINRSCVHILVLVYMLEECLIQGLEDVPAQLACTSIQKEWSKPRSAKIKSEPIPTMVLEKPEKIN